VRLKNDRAAEEQFLRSLETDATNLQAIYHLAAITYRRGAYEASRRYIAACMKAGSRLPKACGLASASSAGSVTARPRRPRAAAAPAFSRFSRISSFLQGQYQ
jgi:hypothetical protein